MDLSSPTAQASQAYAVASRFVPLAPPPPPPVPTFPPLALPPPANPAEGTAGPRFDLAALTTLPPATTPAQAPPTPATPAQAPAPTPVDAAAQAAAAAVAVAAPLQALAPALPLPAPADLTTPGAANIATLAQATALYTQTQQLTGTFGPAQPAALNPPPSATPIEQQQPSTLVSAPPPPLTPPEAASQPSPTQQQPLGNVGIYSLGGVVAGPSGLLGFTRGTFLNLLA
jgi:hypothetical protein